MTISSADALISAMGNNSSRLIIDKASIANAAAGQFHSLWRAKGQPGQAAIPTAISVPTHATVGAIGFVQQTDPATSYLAIIEGLCSNAGTTLEIHDRLCAFGGLSGALTTAQTVNMDLSTLLDTNNLGARKGDANYSDVQWWLEWMADTGATASTVTVNVTYNDGTAGNLTSQAIAATRRASFMLPLNSLIPAAASGKFIRGINTVTLTTSTASVGNIGVTATRYRAALYQPIANARFTADWAGLGLPEIANSACLFGVQVASTTSTGAVKATGKMVHG